MSDTKNTPINNPIENPARNINMITSDLTVFDIIFPKYFIV